ncbi:MAG: hypothetical protein AB3N14_05300 [Flavobacteriaceae bacterium]
MEKAGHTSRGNTAMRQRNVRFTPSQILGGFEGVGIIILCFLTIFLRKARSRWGLSKLDVNRTFPADQLVTSPNHGFTHGIIIEAPAENVWPWIAQIGQGKGGFYSYEALENIMGLNIYNADRILPQYQNPKVGQLVSFGPDAAYPLVYCEPGRGMAIENKLDLNSKKKANIKDSDPSNTVHLTWLWYIEEIDEYTSRFISRNRVALDGTSKYNFIMGILLEPIIFAMDRKMCLGIKKRAERLSKKYVQEAA